MESVGLLQRRLQRTFGLDGGLHWDHQLTITIFEVGCQPSCKMNGKTTALLENSAAARLLGQGIAFRSQIQKVKIFVV